MCNYFIEYLQSNTANASISVSVDPWLWSESHWNAHDPMTLISFHTYIQEKLRFALCLTNPIIYHGISWLICSHNYSYQISVYFPYTPTQSCTDSTYKDCRFNTAYKMYKMTLIYWRGFTVKILPIMGVQKFMSQYMARKWFNHPLNMDKKKKKHL